MGYHAHEASMTANTPMIVQRLARITAPPNPENNIRPRQEYGGRLGLHTRQAPGRGEYREAAEIIATCKEQHAGITLADVFCTPATTDLPRSRLTWS